MTTLRIARKQRWLTLANVARATGISAGDLSRIETGRLIPYPKQRQRLAEFFGMDEKTLFDDEEGVSAHA